MHNVSPTPSNSIKIDDVSVILHFFSKHIDDLSVIIWESITPHHHIIAICATLVFHLLETNHPPQFGSSTMGVVIDLDVTAATVRAATGFTFDLTPPKRDSNDLKEQEERGGTLLDLLSE